MTELIRKITINGVEKLIAAPADRRLIDVLRHDLSLPGTKEGCGEGECGACSVLINERAVASCLMLFGQLADGDSLVTVEGLGGADHLSPLQEAFVSEGAAQCGACTPGMLIAAQALLINNPSPTRDEIARALAGNLCRCTGYAKIIEAVELCAKRMKGEGA